MKPKEKESPRNEFRTSKVTKHPVHIYAKVGDEFKHIGITHSKVTRGIRNIKMVKNPNPKDNETTYFRPKTEGHKTSKYGAKKKEWKLHMDDDKEMKKYRK